MTTPVVFVVDDSYCEDAANSAESYKRNNPDILCIIATDYRGRISDIFDGRILVSKREHPDRWYLDSTRFTLSAFENLQNDYDSLLFVDSDTYCDSPLDDMLRLTERFDVCVTHGVMRHTTGKVCDIPDAFPEHEIGVMLVRTNEIVHNLFKDWLELYESHKDVYGNNDQGPLRDAMWMNKLLNMYVLPEEFHARWGFGVTVVSRVRILHSRSPGYSNERAAREINSTGGRRLFWPGGNIWKPIEGQTRYKG
jgi:hypothetical protein